MRATMSGAPTVRLITDDGPAGGAVESALSVIAAIRVRSFLAVNAGVDGISEHFRSAPPGLYDILLIVPGTSVDVVPLTLQLNVLLRRKWAWEGSVVILCASDSEAERVRSADLLGEREVSRRPLGRAHGFAVLSLPVTLPALLAAVEKVRFNGMGTGEWETYLRASSLAKLERFLPSLESMTARRTSVPAAVAREIALAVREIDWALLYAHADVWSSVQALRTELAVEDPCPEEVRQQIRLLLRRYGWGA